MLSSGSGISSVAHQLSCFGVGSHCAWLLGACFFAHPLSLGQAQWSVSQSPAVSVLWWFADYFSILQCHLTLDVAHWLRRWALWTTTCPISGNGLSPACCWPFCLSSLYWKFMWRSAPCSSPLLWCAFSNSAPLLCVRFQFLVIVHLLSFFFVGGGSACPGCYSSLSQGWLREYCVMLGVHLFGLTNIFQASLDLVSVSGASSPFFSV
jgi:hypothetical protein